MTEYPFLSKVRALLEHKGKKIEWLAGEIGRSVRWIQGLKEPTAIDLKDLDKLSELLDFNFITDYNEWRVEHHQPALFVWNDHGSNYKPENKRVTVKLQISASVANAENNMSQMLKGMRELGEKLGFEID